MRGDDPARTGVHEGRGFGEPRMRGDDPIIDVDCLDCIA